jgi:GT2 family glycosyltransferase
MRINPLGEKSAVSLFDARTANVGVRQAALPGRTTQSQSSSGRLHSISRFVLPQHGMPTGFFGEISGKPILSGMTALMVECGQTYSSESYFNSFFLGLLREITDFQEVILDLDISGAGKLTIIGKSKVRERVLTETKFSGERNNLIFRIASADLAGSDYVFFKLEAKQERISLYSARWDIVCASERPAKLTIGICTHNRDQYLLPNLQRLLADKALMDDIHCLVVVDQGDREQADGPGRAAISHPKLIWRPQRNLGGSGGFSRAMFEAKENGSTHVLLLDDDATYHPESVWRLLQLLKFPGPPRIWGAPMFSLASPSEIYEVSGVYQPTFSRVQSVGQGIHINGGKGLNETLGSLSRNGFSAWFFCCFDVHPGCEQGGALPLFLHYDDVELSYRFQTLGYRHSVVPGLAIWHEASKNRPPWRILLKVRNKLILSTLGHVKSGIPGAIYFWIIYYLVRAAIKGGPGRFEAVVRGMETFAKGPSAAFAIFDEVAAYRRGTSACSRTSKWQQLKRILLAFRGAQQARKAWQSIDSSALGNWRHWQAAWSFPSETGMPERVAHKN